MHRTVYMDYAAATPLDATVLSAMQPFFSDNFYNPSALYMPAQQTLRALDDARATVATVLGARPSEIIFTAGGTESDNVAIQGIMRRYPTSNILVSAIEHDAVLATAEQFNRKIVPVQPDGRINTAALTASIDDQTVLVSIMYANNEIGTVEPVRDVVRAVQAIRETRRQAGSTLPLYVHSDACQAANYLDLHVARLGVDLLTLNGGKIYGPKQSGVLYVKAGIVLEPLIYGGGQERGLRSGTENVAACVGFAVALTQAQLQRSTESVRLQALQKRFIDELARQLPAAVVNGSRKFRLPNNVHITIPGSDNERLLIQLDEAGIYAAAGSACSASKDTPSHVLRAIGLNDANAQSSLRFSFGRQTTEADIDSTVQTLARLAA